MGINVAVLGGLGLQGRATLFDLSRSEAVSHILCADAASDGPQIVGDLVDKSKITFARLDASSADAIATLLGAEVDVAIDLLPQPLMANAFEGAIQAGVDLVTTNYVHGSPVLAERAQAAGVAIMPECGLDPGIDLVVFGHAVQAFDELCVLNSYCGGVPERGACDTPLNYKISWNWETVLRSQTRDSVFIQNGRRLEIPADRQHDADVVRRIEVPGVGVMEAIPNGNAVFYTDLLGVTPTIREAGRYALRWPGWSAFWRPLKSLGFLSDEPVSDLEPPLSPRQFLVAHLGPRLQYQAHEKDLVVMVNLFEGFEAGRRKRLTSRLLIERDPVTGLLAMGLGVGYPVSIVAQMLGRGDIQRKGLLSPAIDVPYERFAAELSDRKIQITEKIEWFDQPISVRAPQGP